MLTRDNIINTNNYLKHMNKRDLTIEHFIKSLENELITNNKTNYNSKYKFYMNKRYYVFILPDHYHSKYVILICFFNI